MSERKFRPKEFLRARRPHKFSDSIIEDEAVLDRAALEYHLATLTSRSQETDFQDFARRLAEREICPNLLPQTGPTGGGDSKVDTETYPVADQIRDGWFEGIGREAASERWAFAISAKEEWRSKVRSDVAKVVGTGRGYQKVFFISSQYIRDKDRASLEDELRGEHGIDTRILDRTWILDKVLKNRHETLAIEALKIGTSRRVSTRKGPRDVQREQELEEREQRIAAALQGVPGLALVDDSIDAALLSRELERPRGETDGRFARAERLAQQHGTAHQRIECAYNRAWTAFWWHEDTHEFLAIYPNVEELVRGSTNGYHLELLTNLYFLLHGLVARGEVSAQDASLEERTVRLTSELERLRADHNRPTTSLQAQTGLLQLQLMRALASKEPIDPILVDFRNVVYKAEGLVGFPMRPLIRFVTEMGEFLEASSAYAGLFDAVVEIAAVREGEITAARLLLKRGRQQLDAERPYDTISTVGRALARLFKHESRYDAVKALYLAGCAYERIGLLWAARGTIITAAALAATELTNYGGFTRLQAACFQKLKWVELRLGRLPHLLEWHAAYKVVETVLADKGHNPSHLSQGEMEFDIALGVLLLKSDLWDLRSLSFLPDVLERLELWSASGALLFALGHEEELRQQWQNAKEEVDLRELFLQWRDEPALHELPDKPLVYEERKVTMQSHVLGCAITLDSKNEPPCVELAESFLAALESFVATSAIDRMMAREPTLMVSVGKSDFARPPFEFAFDYRDARPHVTITCAWFDPNTATPQVQDEIKDQLFKLVVAVVARIVIIAKPSTVIEELFRDERAHERALNFTGSFVAVANVLGLDRRTHISDWIAADAREYRLRRPIAWDAENVRKEVPVQDLAALTPGLGDPPQELLEKGSTRHSEIQAFSVIREHLWDQADWSGMAFGGTYDDAHPPILAPVFLNAEAAEQIFAQWRRELGVDDEKERLRITIVRGIDELEPFSYRVVIGTNLSSPPAALGVRYFGTVSRITTMKPLNNTNLDRFLQSYEKFQACFLVPAIGTPNGLEPEFRYRYHVVKRNVRIRYAWEIGRNELDSAAILPDDRPVIPSEQLNAPILELLHWKRKRK